MQYCFPHANITWKASSEGNSLNWGHLLPLSWWKISFFSFSVNWVSKDPASIASPAFDGLSCLISCILALLSLSALPSNSSKHDSQFSKLSKSVTFLFFFLRKPRNYSEAQTDDFEFWQRSVRSRSGEGMQEDLIRCSTSSLPCRNVNAFIMVI